MSAAGMRRAVKSPTDVVLEEAKEFVSDLTPTETSLLIFVIWMKIYKSKESVIIDEIKESEFIRESYESILDRNREAFFFFGRILKVTAIVITTNGCNDLPA